MKTYEGSMVPIGRNEAKLYRLIGVRDGLLKYLGDFMLRRPDSTGHTIEHQDQPEIDTFNILVEWGECTLYEHFLRSAAPVFQEHIIEFWESIFSVISAVRTIHNLRLNGLDYYGCV